MRLFGIIALDNAQQFGIFCPAEEAHPCIVLCPQPDKPGRVRRDSSILHSKAIGKGDKGPVSVCRGVRLAVFGESFVNFLRCNRRGRARAEWLSQYRVLGPVVIGGGEMSLGVFHCHF